MSEVIRELTVQISANGASTAQKDIKGLQNAVAQADAKFKAAGAGVKDFEKTTAGMQARVAMLNDKLKAQQSIVDKAAGALEKAKTKMTTAANEQQKYADKVEKARAALAKEVAISSKDSEASKALAADLEKLEGQHDALAKSAQTAAQKVQTSETALTKAEAAVKGTEAELKTANTTLEKHGTAWAQAGQKVAAAGEKFTAAGKKLSSVGRNLTMGVTVPVVAAGTAAVKAAIDWESAFTGVEKTVNGTEAQMNALRDGILEMSEAMPSSATEIAKVAESAGQLGIETDNILSFSGAMIDLGNSTNLNAEEAASSLAKFANVMQMNQGNFERLGSVIVDLGNNYATTEADIVSMGQRLAAAGKQTGMTEANVMAIATALSSVGVEAEAGGSAFSKVMLEIDMAAAKGGKGIKQYAKVAGSSAKDFTAAWNTDPAAALNAFVVGLGNVEKNGGNAALVLESMGLTETRLRNALLSTASAGDVLSNAIRTANNAWAENNALSTEAEKRYGTTASKLAMLKNQAVNLGASFGKVMVPWLEQAMDKVSGLLSGFSEMNPAMQQSTITFGLLAAATGPVLSGFGKIATGAGALIKLFTGPAGWVAIAATALAGFGIIVANVKSQTQLLDEKLRGVKIKIDTEDVTQITSDINGGIEAAKKVHEVTVAVEADTKELSEKLEKAFEDDKFTKKEYKAASKYVKDMVAPDIKAATIIIDGKTKEMQDALDGAVNAEGQPLSEEEKTALINQITAKTTTLVTDLQTAQADYEKLIKEIYNQRKPATEAQMAALNALLARITTIRTELKLASEDAYNMAKADYNKTIAGQGTTENFGGAIGFVQGQQQNAVEEARKKLDAVKATAGAMEDTAAANNNLAIAENEYAKSVALAGEEAQKGYQAIADGVAKVSGAENTIATITQDTEAFIAAAKVLSQENMSDNPDWLKNYRDILGEGGILSKYLSEGDKITLDDLLSFGNETNAISFENARKILQGLTNQLGTALTTNVEDQKLNPLFEIVQSMMDSGAFTDLDTTKFEGALEGIFNALDIKDKGVDVGKPIGADTTDGIAAGMTEQTPVAVTAVNNVFTAMIAEANRMRPLLNNAMGYISGGGTAGGNGSGKTGSPTFSPTASINIGQYVASNANNDAEILLANQQRLLKNMQTAYGKFPSRLG